MSLQSLRQDEDKRSLTLFQTPIVAQKLPKERVVETNRVAK